jgi:hypothetical protein
VTRSAEHPWYRELTRAVADAGGLRNAHLHLDRAGTYDDSYLRGSGTGALKGSAVSLHEKHALIHDLHRGGAYGRADFLQRVGGVLDSMEDVGTSLAETLVDVSADEVGLRALHLMRELQGQRDGPLSLRIGAYAPFGFTDAEPQRWEVFVEGAGEADFLGCLPEADDVRENPGHIGFREHCRSVLTLAVELDKPVQVHVDQRNEPTETGTEDLVAVADELGWRHREGEEPRIWAVHAISPSTYSEDRFERLVEGMLRRGIGVITCPTAALGMRMYRPVRTPTFNSIPRVLDLVAAGVRVRIGSDNIADICSPSTTSNLFDEVFVLSAAIRFYDVRVLAKLAAGIAPDDADRAAVRAHLDENARYIDDFLATR